LTRGFTLPDSSLPSISAAAARLIDVEYGCIVVVVVGNVVDDGGGGCGEVLAAAVAVVVVVVIVVGVIALTADDNDAKCVVSDELARARLTLVLRAFDVVVVVVDERFVERVPRRVVASDSSDKDIKSGSTHVMYV
jgi:hypothetical protein